MHSASNGADGANPNAALLQGTNGNFYGVTFKGGAHNDGEAFEFTSGGKLKVLHSFDGTDGANPAAALIEVAGNFYGTTLHGGANNEGTIFKMTPGGTITTLHNFSGADGAHPEMALLQATDGNFYGTTFGGGAHNEGTIFKLSDNLPANIKTVPESGNIGARVVIEGTDLTGTTGVKFNGTAAKFKIVSATEITTTVPMGATTGTVEVTAHGGTLSSNGSFQVQ